MCDLSTRIGAGEDGGCRCVVASQASRAVGPDISGRVFLPADFLPLPGATDPFAFDPDGVAGALSAYALLIALTREVDRASPPERCGLAPGVFDSEREFARERDADSP